ncbi:MAG: hypothetical protein E5Y63_18325 [Mesorhizobium sp.]|uniref:hypothetical protein n=1 Tax=Mesorhizobium sp. TaxID=1871066 RepID=UPI0012054A73|nr:hypothetical protein [Mesorhizobium sp.]TIM28854.1 MAG: hypothetical protein E5Y63_18325 [Mesorhizobium sp.]TIO21292.1 MAG: hypothetical protein E5X83_30280 [Mesorhizobium sp.]
MTTALPSYTSVGTPAEAHRMHQYGNPMNPDHYALWIDARGVHRVRKSRSRQHSSQGIFKIAQHAI